MYITSTSYALPGLQSKMKNQIPYTINTVDGTLHSKTINRWQLRHLKLILQKKKIYTLDQHAKEIYIYITCTLYWMVEAQELDIIERVLRRWALIQLVCTHIVIATITLFIHIGTNTYYTSRFSSKTFVTLHIAILGLGKILFYPFLFCTLIFITQFGVCTLILKFKKSVRLSYVSIRA